MEDIGSEAGFLPRGESDTEKEKWSYLQVMIVNKYYQITGQTQQDEINCSKNMPKV